MEHDIRELFNNDKTKVEIPQNHRADFLNKLKHQSKKEQKNSNKNYWAIAVSVALILVTSVYFISIDADVEKPTLQTQVAKIEKEYLINIDKEWKEFIEVAEDSVLINKYEQKMLEFDKDYQQITKVLKKSPNNINALESLINNLQRRLQLIKNIKAHIKKLNQKNTSNETIYI